jgi:hypothetical protein
MLDPANLPALLQSFFTTRLMTQRKASPHTVRWPFRCYRLNVELETEEYPISRASARQLHISDNFTISPRQARGLRVGLEPANQRVIDCASR